MHSSWSSQKNCKSDNTFWSSKICSNIYFVWSASFDGTQPIVLVDWQPEIMKLQELGGLFVPMLSIHQNIDAVECCRKSIRKCKQHWKRTSTITEISPYNWSIFVYFLTELSWFLNSRCAMCTFMFMLTCQWVSIPKPPLYSSCPSLLWSWVCCP